MTQPLPQSTEGLLLKKLCMLGSFGVGKTSLVRRFVESIFDDRYLTTVGVRIDRKRVTAGGRDMHLVLWDLAGEDELTQPKLSQVRGASGYILVIDGCRRSTLDKAVAIQQRAAALYGPIPVVVALNKADLSHEWEIKQAEVDDLTRIGWSCFRTSAKTGAGVDGLFVSMAEKMLSEMNERTAE